MENKAKKKAKTKKVKGCRYTVSELKYFEESLNDEFQYTSPLSGFSTKKLVSQ